MEVPGFQEGHTLFTNDAKKEREREKRGEGEKERENEKGRDEVRTRPKLSMESFVL